MSAVSRLLANDPVFNRRGGARGGRGGGGRAKRNHGLAVEMGLEDDLDDNLGASQASSVGSPNTSKKGGKRSKEYVPKTRSGAYAVLLTLYEWSKKPDYVGYMRKAELQTHAQPLSDQPFNIQNAHSEFYTAWSGVNTLMKHALMTKWSNPCKYNITEKGMELAMRIHSTENNINLSQQSQAHTSSGRSLMEDTPRASSSTVTSQSIRDEAPPRVTPDKRSSAANFSMNLDDLSFSESFHEPGFSQAGPSSTPGFSQAGSSSTLGFSQAGPSRSLSRHLTDVEDDLLNPGLLLQKNIQKNMLLEVQPSCGLRHQPEFRLVPGRFEILLCVDNTETAGGGVGGRKTLKAETVRHLAECGVAYDRRNLNIGDFLWIAREKIAAIPGQFQQRAPRELVLPYIVERKRLDDLWASVKDGRYEEQKFRMKSSGLTNLYYLIEDYSVQKQNWGQAARGQMVTSEAIQQAICNTAVQEGFTVVKTKDQRATIEHLTLFTRILQNKYKDSTLASCTQADFADGLVTDRETSLLTFPELNSAARKNRKMTLKEIFAKMLLRLKGLSVDMAQGLVEEFPTPTQFRDALLSVDTIDQRIKLIQDVSVGLQSKRKITRPLAEALAKFWTQLDLN